MKRMDGWMDGLIDDSWDHTNPFPSSSLPTTTTPTHTKRQHDDTAQEALAKCVLRAMVVLEKRLEGEEKDMLVKAGKRLLLYYGRVVKGFKTYEAVLHKFEPLKQHKNHLEVQQVTTGADAAALNKRLEAARVVREGGGGVRFWSGWLIVDCSGDVD